MAFDTRGVVVKAAVMGKVGDSDGDTLAEPTTTFEYDLFAFQNDAKPTYTKARARIIHDRPDGDRRRAAARDHELHHLQHA